MGQVLVGTASWLDRSLVASGLFYPPEVTTPEARLRFYADRFPMVEVDSSYYAIPARRTAALWAERTPDRFVFDVKAFRLFTQHPTPPDAIPRDLREAIPPAGREKRNLYLKDVPPEVTDRLWQDLAEAIQPLDAAGKLGVVLFQFPSWFRPSREHLDYIRSCQENVPRYRVAVEFRHSSWFSDQWLPEVTAALRGYGMPLVVVDMPHDVKGAVPVLLETTSPDVAVVRMHGHNTLNWTKPNATIHERVAYLYTDEELERWAGRVHQLAEQAREVHVILNTNYQDYAQRNAARLRTLLQRTPHPPQEIVL